MITCKGTSYCLALSAAGHCEHVQQPVRAAADIGDVTAACKANGWCLQVDAHRATVHVEEQEDGDARPDLDCDLFVSSVKVR